MPDNDQARTPETLRELADRVERVAGADRELADEVLLAGGWQLNHDADDVAGWRIDPGTCEGEDGQDYPVTLADRMNWACWYKPGSRPFRDSWIDGHYRPDPLASLDAAVLLVPAGARALIDSDGCHCRLTHPDWPWNGFAGFAGTMSLAVVAASLRALAASLETTHAE